MSNSQPLATKSKTAPTVKNKIPQIKNPFAGARWFLRRYVFLEENQSNEDEVVHAKSFMVRQKRLMKLIQLQNYIITGLLVLVILLAPVLRPIYNYMGKRPDLVLMSMASMTVPNLTDQTIISWSATAITDILTFGFGDLDQRIISQRYKFTDDGWTSFVKGFVERHVGERFRGNQLVLTTAPADIPVIVKKGEDENGIFKWVVEMPVIMNYSTNNMVSTKGRSVIRLILRRVPTSQNTAGIGIDTWIVS